MSVEKEILKLWFKRKNDMKKVLFLCIGLLFASCSNVHHGYKFEDGDKDTIKEMVARHSHIQEIINKFGSPTFINSPINDLLCYVSVDGKRVPFNRFYKPKYDFVCVQVENGLAKGMYFKTFDNIKEEKMVKYDNSIDELLIKPVNNEYKKDDNKEQNDTIN